MALTLDSTGPARVSEGVKEGVGEEGVKEGVGEVGRKGAGVMLSGRGVLEFCIFSLVGRDRRHPASRPRMDQA